jgi:hypothetical protein
VYNLNAIAAKVQIWDIVWVRNVTLRWKQKIAEKWESIPYETLSQPDENTPVFVVKQCGRKSEKKIKNTSQKSSVSYENDGGW